MGNESTRTITITMTKFIEAGLLVLIPLLMVLFFLPVFPRWNIDVPTGFLSTVAGLIVILGFFRIVCFVMAVPSILRQHHRRIGLVIAASLILVLATRWQAIVYPHAFPNADSEMSVLMLRHISMEGIRPLYFYGQHYQGIAQIYAAVPLVWVGLDQRLSLFLVNFLCFSCTVGLMAIFMRTRYRVHEAYTLFFLSGTQFSFMFVSLDLVHGFSLVALLMMIALMLTDRVVNNPELSRSPVRTSVWHGLVCGLLFYQYQPSVVVVGLLTAWLFIFRRSIRVVIAWTTGFFAASTPHILSELYNEGINIRSLLFSTDASIVTVASWWQALIFPARKLDIPLQSPGWELFYTLLLIAGLSMIFLSSFRRRDIKILLFPSLYLAIVTALACSGFDPENPRFQVHFLFYGPFAALLMTATLSWSPLQNKRIIIVILCGALFLLNGMRVLRYGDAWPASHREMVEGLSRLDSMPERLVLGDYWVVMQYLPYRAADRLTVTSPTLLGYGLPYHSGTIKYWPLMLLTADRWNTQDIAIVNRDYCSNRMRTYCDSLGIAFTEERLSVQNIVFRGFEPRPSIEIVSLLANTSVADEHMADVTSPVPREQLQPASVTIEDGTVTVDWTPAPRDSLRFLNYDLVISRDNGQFQLRMPVYRLGGQMKFTMPHALTLSSAEYEYTILLYGYPLYRGKVPLTSRESGSGPPLRCSVSRIGDERHYLGWQNEPSWEHVIKGCPLEESLHIVFPPHTAKTLTLTCLSLFDFGSTLWNGRFQQELIVETNRERLVFPLDFGYNTVSFPLEGVTELRLSQRYRAFTRTWATAIMTEEDTRQTYGMCNTGLILTHMYLISDFDKKTSILPTLTIAPTHWPRVFSLPLLGGYELRHNE